MLQMTENGIYKKKKKALHATHKAIKELFYQNTV